MLTKFLMKSYINSFSFLNYAGQFYFKIYIIHEEMFENVVSWITTYCYFCVAVYIVVTGASVLNIENESTTSINTLIYSDYFFSVSFFTETIKILWLSRNMLPIFKKIYHEGKINLLFDRSRTMTFHWAFENWRSRITTIM